MPFRRPSLSGASFLKTVGLKSRFQAAQLKSRYQLRYDDIEEFRSYPMHSSWTVTTTVVPPYVAAILRPQIGFRFGLAVAPGNGS